MGNKITQQQASEKAGAILAALKGENSQTANVDVSFILYLTELIANRGSVDDPALSRELVNDLIAAMMQHGINMHDWPLILSHLVKALHMVILYNIPEEYQERAAQLTAEDLLQGFDRTRKEYHALMGIG